MMKTLIALLMMTVSSSAQTALDNYHFCSVEGSHSSGRVTVNNPNSLPGSCQVPVGRDDGALVACIVVPADRVIDARLYRPIGPYKDTLVVNILDGNRLNIFFYTCAPYDPS